MKKNLPVVIVCIFITLVLLIGVVFTIPANAAGGYQWFDTAYSYDRAIIKLPNGEIIDGKCQSWRDYEDGDQLQVKVNGKTYLTHATNVVLIDE